MARRKTTLKVNTRQNGQKEDNSKGKYQTEWPEGRQL